MGANINIDNFFPKEIVTNISNAEKAIKEYEKTLKKINANETSAANKVQKAENRQTILG